MKPLQHPFVEPSYPLARMEHFRALLALPGFDLGELALGLLRPLLPPKTSGGPAAGGELPFAFDDALDAAADRALEDLAELSCRRASGELEPPAQPLGALGRSDPRRLSAPSCSLGFFPVGSLAQATARRATRLDPALDSGLLEAWLLRGPGGALGSQLEALCARARAEDARPRAGSAHLPLAVLALGNVLRAKCERLRRLATRSLSPDALERAAGLACFALVEAAAERSLSSPALSAGAGEPRSCAEVRGLFSALSFMAPRADPLACDLNPWELSASFAAAADRLWLDLLERDPDPRDAKARMEAAIGADRAAQQSAAHAAAGLLARRRLFAWRSLYDGVDPELSAELDGLTRSDSALFAALRAPRPLLSRLQRFARARKSDPSGEAATAALAEALRRGPVREDGLGDVAGAYTCLALDRAAAASIGAARARLRDRRAELTRDEMIGAYAAGHLFRLSADEKVLRRTPTSRSQGFLALDLSAYCERALLAPRGTGAELLRRHLWDRIAAAAAQVAQAFPEGALAAGELSAHAATFSGDVGALVQLAQALRPVRRGAAEILLQHTALPGEKVQSRRRELEAELLAELEALRAEALSLEARLAHQRALEPAERELALWRRFREREGDLEEAEREALERKEAAEAAQWKEALEALRHEEMALFARVERQFGPPRDELVLQECQAGERSRLRQLEREAAQARERCEAQRRALDEEARAFPPLESGLLIDFGPEALSLEVADSGMGFRRVALSEAAAKAARGVATAPLAKAKLDALVRRARSDKDLPGLEYPFRVFVSPTKAAVVPDEIDALFDRALREREPAFAREGSRRLQETVLRDLARAMGLGDGRPAESLAEAPGLYNAGEVLTGQALEALLEESADGQIAFRRELAVDELDPEFALLFAFPSSELELAVSVPRDGDATRATVFRRAGPMPLGRFELRSPAILWELLLPESTFVLLLQQKHLDRWTAEERLERRARRA